MLLGARMAATAVAAVVLLLASGPLASRSPWTSASDQGPSWWTDGFVPGSIGEANRAWPHETLTPSPDPSVAPTRDPIASATPEPPPDPTLTPTPDPASAPPPAATGEATPDPTLAATPDPTPNPTPSPTSSSDPSASPAAGAYTFDEEFDGPVLDPLWLRHFHCCGELAGYDPLLSAVADGALSMRVDQRSDGWYGDIIDTKTTFTQQYGYFEARIKVPKGRGLWPAFWGYSSGYGTEGEIDGMEICANQIGDNGGNDASLLHTTIHWPGDASGQAFRSVDLSEAYHVYAFDWRSTAIRFYLDGQLVWTFTDTAHIPTMALPVILNLGVGGAWCGSPDATTPDGAEMLVDWVRVRP